MAAVPAFAAADLPVAAFARGAAAVPLALAPAGALAGADFATLDFAGVGLAGLDLAGVGFAEPDFAGAFPLVADAAAAVPLPGVVFEAGFLTGAAFAAFLAEVAFAGVDLERVAEDEVDFFGVAFALRADVAADGLAVFFLDAVLVLVFVAGVRAGLGLSVRARTVFAGSFAVERCDPADDREGLDFAVVDARLWVTFWAMLRAAERSLPAARDLSAAVMGAAR